MSTPSKKILIIANKTLGGPELLEAVDRMNTPVGSVTFHLLVPATPVGESPWEHGDYRRRAGVEEAQARLRRGLELISERDAGVDGEVGETDPIDAVRVLFDRGMTFDRILLSTFTSGWSRWLRLDVPHRLGRVTNTPVEHIQSEIASGVG